MVHWAFMVQHPRSCIAPIARLCDCMTYSPLAVAAKGASVLVRECSSLAFAARQRTMVAHDMIEQV